MNERIRELAREAAGGLLSYNAEGEFHLSEKEVEKFAELIVKECMGICDEVQTQYGQYTFTATTCKNRFKQHFGVE